MQNLSAIESLGLLPASKREEILDSLSDEDLLAIERDWRIWARPDQIAPEGEWSIWVVLAGRGWGKTRVGAEWVRENVEGSTPLSAGKARRIALVAETAADARDVMVEGDSGLLSVHSNDYRPMYEPSKRRLTWPNGAVATLYNATEPDQLRGPQHDLSWSDELAKWRYARETWDMLQFGLRLGTHPRQIVTTTPRPIELLRELVARYNRNDGAVVITKGRTLDNAANLAAPFLKEIRERYEGTRLGRQELDAEILDDAPGALWTRRSLDEWRVRAPKATMRRIVVGVDPAITEEGDEHGVVVAGLGEDGRGYLLEDASLHGTPDQWARRAWTMLDKWEADALVIETNQGGDMVKHTLRSVRTGGRIIEVRASRGKHVRAEPVSALYEQGRVSHVGLWPELEDQMVLMTSHGYEGEKSPDRLDAAVWAFSELFPRMVDKRRAPAPRAPRRGSAWAV